MNLAQYILYNILLGCQIHVHTHAADKTVWRLCGNVYEGLEPLTADDLMGLATCALQQWILITKDQFHDIQVLEKGTDAIIIQLR